MTGTGRAMANTPVMAQKHPTNFPPAGVDKIEKISGKLTDICSAVSILLMKESGGD